MCTVIGSGFGMYGYLPALIDGIGANVILPLSEKEKIRKRSELANLEGYIRWVENLDAVLSEIDTVVIAVPPAFQPVVAQRCLNFPNIKKYVLEKPIAVCPEKASSLLCKLDFAKKRYVIGYTFLHLEWQKNLALIRDSSGIVEINWFFMAHHFANNLNVWKRFHSEGGGVLRFFGIHLLAMLSMYGYEEVSSFQMDGDKDDEPDYMEAAFTGPALPICRLKVCSRSKIPVFEITGSGLCGGIKLIEPFENEKKIGKFDRRVAVLLSILKIFENNYSMYRQNYFKAIELWKQLENLLN